MVKTISTPIFEKTSAWHPAMMPADPAVVSAPAVTVTPIVASASAAFARRFGCGEWR